MLGTLASISRLHIVAIGAMGALTFGFALTGERPWLLALLVACDWFVVNLLNRVVDLKEDAANGIRGVELVARHRRAVLAVGVGALLASFAATAAVAPALLPLRAAFHALGFAYNWPLLPWPRGANPAEEDAPPPRWRRARIKQLYFWKNTASAVGFLLTCFGYPLALVTAGRAALLSDVTPAAIAAAAGFFFLFELSYEVVYDQRDLDGDRLAGVRSYPAVHGARVGWIIAASLMVGAFVVAAATYAAGVLPWRVAVMAAAPLIQLAVVARIVVVQRRAVTSADCIGVTWLGVALLVGYHAWEALGLPGAG